MPCRDPQAQRDRVDGQICRYTIAGVSEGIEGAEVTLPKYSPDFNPIELAFSKLKAHLRRAAE